MTLRQQFSILLSFLLVVLLCSSLALTVLSSRDYFQEQLNSRAYDAATSLALAMSQIHKDHKAQQERVIDVLFDRGFFEQINFERLDGEGSIRRHASLSQMDKVVPGWFKRLVSFELLAAETDVIYGWHLVGTVTVVSHSDYAYRDLWNLAKKEIMLFFWILVISLIILVVLLRWLFQPIKNVEKQALAIAEKNWSIQSQLPRTRELKRVVLAMNKLATKLGSIFNEQAQHAEQLRRESFQDSLTGLLNRAGFDQRLNHILESEEENSGVLLILQVSRFSEFNLSEGRHAGDDFLKDLGSCLYKWLEMKHASFVGRRSGVDFTLYCPVVSRDSALEVMTELYQLLGTTLLSRVETLNIHMGGSFIQGSRQAKKYELSQVLSQADAALRQAQGQPNTGYALYEDGYADGHEWTATQWRQILIKVLESDAIGLKYAPVLNTHKQVIQYEVYSHIEWQEESISAARCWPMIERHALTASYDYAIISHVIQNLRSHSALVDSQRFCINLSPASLMDESFRNKLLSLCALYPEQAACLAFELPEFSLSYIELAYADLIKKLASYSVEFGIDKIGTGTLAFSYLQRIPLSYIRLDGNLNRGVHGAQDRKFFIQSMVQIAHNLDLNIYAEGLEDQADIETVLLQSADGVSGYYFTRPLASLEEALAWLPQDE